MSRVVSIRTQAFTISNGDQCLFRVKYRSSLGTVVVFLSLVGLLTRAMRARGSSGAAQTSSTFNKLTQICVVFNQDVRAIVVVFVPVESFLNDSLTGVAWPERTVSMVAPGILNITITDVTLNLGLS